MFLLIVQKFLGFFKKIFQLELQIIRFLREEFKIVTFKLFTFNQRTCVKKYYFQRKECSMFFSKKKETTEKKNNDMIATFPI